MGVVGASRARFLVVDVQFERKGQTETRLKNPLDFGKSESSFSLQTTICVPGKWYWERQCPVICSLSLPSSAWLPEFVFGSTLIAKTHQLVYALTCILCYMTSSVLCSSLSFLLCKLLLRRVSWHSFHSLKPRLLGPKMVYKLSATLKAHTQDVSLVSTVRFRS